MTNINFFIILFTLFFFSEQGSIAATVDENKLFLSERAPLAIVDVPLSKEDWYWLRAKKTLKIGVYKLNSPPFDMFVYNQEYSGATADYSDLVSQLLGVRFEFYRYKNKNEALNSLAEGRVDLLGTANRFDILEKPFILSKPYVEDQPALISNIGDERHFSEGLEGLNLAVVTDYIEISKLKSKYPKANIKFYSSINDAMGAVAFKRMDLLIADVTTAHYLINNNYSKYLKIYKKIDIRSDGYSFAFNKNNIKLRNIINHALDSIPVERKVNILMRWGGGSSTLIEKQRLLLTTKEQEWLAEHPIVRIDVSDFQAPISYFDEHGKYRGLISDVLNNIELQTGVRFEVKRNPVFSTMTTNLLDKNTDILAGPTYTKERLKSFLFTRPFFKDQYAFIVKNGRRDINSFKDLEGKTIALTSGFLMINFVRDKYPNIKIIETKNNIEALGLVYSGQVDTTISTLAVAEHYLTGFFNGGLSISSNLDLEESGIVPQAVFVVRRGDVELHSILDKALLSIPPDEYALLVSRWQPNAAASPLKWTDYQVLIYQLLAIVFLCITLMFIWNYRLRKKGNNLQSEYIALAERLLFMENITNGSPFSIYVRDSSGVLILCNDYMLNELNLKREDIVGRMSAVDLVRDRVIEGLEADYERVLNEGVSMQGVRRAYIGGKTLSVYLWIYAYRGFNGKIKGVVCGYSDVTESQQLLDDFKKEKENADSASKAKTMFLATMSHEIRTPINAVVGMLELVLKKAEREIFDMAAIEIAYSSAKNLLELIGDILDVVRIESGGISLAPERCNFREQVESVFRVFDGLARQKSLRLLLDFDSSVNYDVLMDPLRFKQILSNILSNAIKFTQSGQISIRIVGVLTEQGYLNVQLWVKDSGIGISEKDLSRLFEPFSQAENHTQNARQGTGLGLVISRNLCELMGGSLQLKSAIGQGTEVKIALKVIALDPLSELVLAEDTSRQHLGVLNILVVDDHRVNRLLLCEQLNYLGHQVRSAEDGAVALMYWRDEFFDVVISDCNMPVMSGYALTEQIRKEESELKRDSCVVFGLTANAQAEERDYCISLGMNDCLFKPIGVDSLAKYLSAIPRNSFSRGRKLTPYNLERLESLTGQQPKVIKKLLDEMIHCNREDLNLLLNYFDDMDILSINDLVHKIKGAASVIQARGIISACETVEAACKGVGDVGILLSSISSLEEEILLLEQELLLLLDSFNDMDV